MWMMQSGSFRKWKYDVVLWSDVVSRDMHIMTMQGGPYIFFDAMVDATMVLNSITSLDVRTTCSHAGLVDEGLG